jgi:predicted DNA-binding transcriptional regulator AlpA
MAPEGDGLFAQQLKRRVLDKTFPERRRISPRRISRPASDVKRWLDDLDANRRQRG